MALRYLAGKLRVPAGAALRRVEGSRGFASCSCQKVTSTTEEELKREENLKRLQDEIAALMRQIREAPPNKRNHSTELALYISGGTIIGVFLGSLMLRYEHRSGGKIGKFMCGIPSE